MDVLFQTIIAALLLAAQPTNNQPPDAYSGSLSRYAPNVMEDVVEWRHTNGIPDGFNPHQPEYDGFVAVVDCRNVGRTGWMTLTVEGVEREPLRVYVADCASPGTAAAKWMADNQIAAELDYAAWVREGIVDGRGAWAEIVLDGGTAVASN